jgi:hypothetical protein
MIAVYYASRQHRVMGRCLNSSQIKAWIENDEGALSRLVSRDLNSTQRRKPAASSILTISGPVIMLSASLNSFLAGFGVYLGIIWTKGLDEDADPGDSRNVFLLYDIGLGVCYYIYALSGSISRSGSTDRSVLKKLLRQANKHSGNAGDPPESPPCHSRPEGDHVRMEPINTSAENLVRSLHEAATLREQSAEADRCVADIYRELGRQVQTGTPSTR